MAQSEDLEFHPAEAQLDMFAVSPSRAAPRDVRAELADVLTQVRSASRETMDAADVAHLRNIFSRMSELLPGDEAARLRLELDASLAQLIAA